MKIRCGSLKIGLVLLAALLLSSFLLYHAAFAQDALTQMYAGGVKGMLRTVLGGNVPEEWLSLPNFFYFIVFPFVAAWAVIYGVMEEIQIFRRARTSHKVVSFVMAAMLLPTGWLMIIVNYFYMIDAWVALMAFGVVFLFGTIAWGYGRFVGLRGDYWDPSRARSNVRSLDQRIRELQRQIGDIDERAASGGISFSDAIKQKNKLYDEIAKLKTAKEVASYTS